MTRVLVTGASGLVGRALCGLLSESGYVVRAALRTAHQLRGVSERVVIANIDGATNWSAALKGVDSVIHLAARAHVLHDTKANEDLYMETNVRGTQGLLRASSESGIRQFIFLSSIKVNGEQTTTRPYCASDTPKPADSYGKSKLLAEQAAVQTSAVSGMEVAIVRSPLVYGPGVRANFLRLLKWVDKGRLLPLGAIDNRRSLASVWNLCDLLLTILMRPMSGTKVWMVSDGRELSTPQLIQCVARVMGRRARLVAVPGCLLSSCGALIGRTDMVTRLCGSLVVDISETRTGLGWDPPVTVEEGLARTVAWYRSTTRRQLQISS